MFEGSMLESFAPHTHSKCICKSCLAGAIFRHHSALLHPHADSKTSYPKPKGACHLPCCTAIMCRWWCARPTCAMRAPMLMPSSKPRHPQPTPVATLSPAAGGPCAARSRVPLGVVPLTGLTWSVVI